MGERKTMGEPGRSLLTQGESMGGGVAVRVSVVRVWRRSGPGGCERCGPPRQEPPRQGQLESTPNLPSHGPQRPFGGKPIPRE